MQDKEETKKKGRKEIMSKRKRRSKGKEGARGRNFNRTNDTRKRNIFKLDVIKLSKVRMDQSLVNG